MSIIDWGAALNFEPTKDTKQKILFTRKAKRIVAGMTLPGLFQVSHFALDVLGFFVVIVLEIWGLMNFLVVGQIDFKFVAVLFAVDVALGIARHYPAGKTCEFENRLLVESDPDKQDNYAAKINRRRLVMRVISTMILAIAMFKVLSFWSIVQAFNGLVLAILVSYVFVAFLHITATGNFLFGALLWLSVRLDRRRFTSDSDNVKQSVTIQTFRTSEDFESPVELTLAQTGKHKLMRVTETSEPNTRSTQATEPSGPRRYTYRFETWGMFRDRELDQIASMQSSPEKRRLVFEEGIKHQLYILGSEPDQGTGASPSINQFAIAGGVKGQSRR